MRFIVQNVAKRSAAPTSRVTLGGRPLPYGAIRVITGMPDALAKELYALLQAGVVEVACGGKYLDAGYFASAPVTVAIPVAPPAPEPEVVVPEVSPEVIPEVVPEAPPVVPTHTEESLNAMKVADLRVILDSFIPGSSVGKLKAQLVEAILLAQGA